MRDPHPRTSPPPAPGFPRRVHAWLAVIGLALAASLAAAAWASDLDSVAGSYSRKGADTCLACHNEHGVIDLFRTPHGSPADVRDEVARRIADLAPGGGFVLGAVHDIQDDVPVENILAMVDAAAEFGRLIVQQPDDLLALRNRGLCYHDQGLFDQALTDYNKAIELAANDAITWFQRGNVLLEQTKLQDAIADYDKAITLNPDYAKAWMNRGVARFHLNQRVEAIKDLQHAQELDDSIILPAIDWLHVDATVESVDADVAAARPVYLEAGGSGAWAVTASARPSTSRVSAGSRTPSSQRRALP